ncbi:MAG: DUF5777 family beta-barrel protein [Chitinophagaceae bacterium]
MKRIFTLAYFLISLQLLAQDEKKPVQIFSSDKVVNANTPEVTGKGKMAFKVTHNFGDLAGSNGGIKKFFGLDNASDIRIAFNIGVGKKFDIIAARSKGAGLVQNLWELGLKYQLMQQFENDPSHPIALTLFANSVVSTQKANAFPNQENSFDDFGDRISNVLQLIIAKKMGKIGVELNPTLLTRGYAVSYDQKTMFAMGGAIKIPLVQNRLNLLVDYFHPFRKEAVEDSFRVNDNIKFYDPLGIGFEIITSGHIFRLNFTNATEILENRFIPRTISSWGKGQFRWGFTISRNFVLWRGKEGSGRSK